MHYCGSSCEHSGRFVALSRANSPTMVRMNTVIATSSVSVEPAVVGRFAPSPSGRMHLGNAFSCLMAWLGARSVGGRMVLRIEDLDPRARSRDRADLLMRDLEWLGLDWDEGPSYQTERTALYEDALERLRERGLIYPCFCTRQQLHAATAPHASDGTYVYQGTCRGLSPSEVEHRSKTRPPAMRLRVPEADDPAGDIRFDDLVYGHHEEILAQECGDFLVRRSDGVFAYQLAVTVDDALMGVTQVVRGRDLLGSVARQVYLFRLLGFDAPTYAHVPLLVAADGRRLSKRDRDLDLGVLQERGVDPRRVVGVLAHAAGLVATSDPVGPRDLLEDFDWSTISHHRTDIVVDSQILL